MRPRQSLAVRGGALGRVGGAAGVSGSDGGTGVVEVGQVDVDDAVKEADDFEGFVAAGAAAGKRALLAEVGMKAADVGAIGGGADAALGAGTIEAALAGAPAAGAVEIRQRLGAGGEGKLEELATRGGEAKYPPFSSDCMFWRRGRR